MEVSKSHVNSGSDSNTLDNSTMMFAADCNVAPVGLYQQLLLDGVMTPPHIDGAQVDAVDHASILQDLDDMEQFDEEPAPDLDWKLSQQQLSWEPTEQLQLNWEPSQELECPPASETMPEFSTVDQSEDASEKGVEDGGGEADQSRGSGGECAYNHIDESTVGLTQLPLSQFGDKMDDVGQLDWERAPEQKCELSQQQSWEPTEQLQLNWEPLQELECLSESETMPEFSTVDQSEESSETGPDDGGGEEDQSRGSGRECSDNHTDESAVGLTSLPVVPPGESIGVGYHTKNKQWESHLWIRGPRLRGRRKTGMQIYLGNFETEEEAKVAHDRAAIKLKMHMQPVTRRKPYALNFPAAAQASYMEEHADWTDRDFLWKIRRTSNKFSKGKSEFKGVSFRKQSVKRGQEWVTKCEAKISLTDKEHGDDIKRTFMLGNFDSQEEAARAYDLALLFICKHRPEVEQLTCITNFRPSSYSAQDIEAMASQVNLPRPPGNA